MWRICYETFSIHSLAILPCMFSLQTKRILVFCYSKSSTYVTTRHLLFACMLIMLLLIPLKWAWIKLNWNYKLYVDSSSFQVHWAGNFIINFWGLTGADIGFQGIIWWEYGLHSKQNVWRFQCPRAKITRRNNCFIKGAQRDQVYLLTHH